MMSRGCGTGAVCPFFFPLQRGFGFWHSATLRSSLSPLAPHVLLLCSLNPTEALTPSAPFLRPYFCGLPAFVFEPFGSPAHMSALRIMPSGVRCMTVTAGLAGTVSTLPAHRP